MSEVWLIVAIGCVFGAVVLFGIFFDLNQSERRRAVRLLESQVAGTQSGILVQPTAATSLIISGAYPSTTIAGDAHDFTITARDQFGNTATGYTGTVVLSSNDTHASFAPLSYTFQTSDAGVHTFSATLNTAGTRSITATDSGNMLSATQNGTLYCASMISAGARSL